MQTFLKIIPWVVMIVAGVLLWQFLYNPMSDESSRLQTYNRQLNKQLTDKEKELQEAHSDLGVAESELVSQKELADRLAKEKEEVDKNFQAFRKKYDLIIKSKDKTIAALKQKLQGGDSTVTVTPTDSNSDNDTCDIPQFDCSKLQNYCIISYEWNDTLNRFKLTDPNIFKKNDERFEASQIFKIYGEVYEQKDGSLQVKRIVLREVVLGEDGKYKNIPGAKAKIVESKFEYHNPPPDPKLETTWRDLFKIRMIAVASINMFPDLGRTKFGLGIEFFNWRGLGLNTHTAFSFTDASKIEQHIGLSYSPKIKNIDLNVGIMTSIGTPFANMFRSISFNISLIFYLNN